MDGHVFHDVLTTEVELRAVLGAPGELAVQKQLNALDDHCRAFIALSPFLLIGSSDGSLGCDVSPRGDAPGFVLVLDDRTLVIPDRPGNRRVDTLRNIVSTPYIGLLFIVPGFEETLRVNGRAVVTRDSDILDRTCAGGKRPTLAIGVHVDEVFFQCAKALRRSKLWDPANWPERSVFPSLGRILLDQARPRDVTEADLEADLVESYAKRLY